MMMTVACWLDGNSPLQLDHTPAHQASARLEQETGDRRQEARLGRDRAKGGHFLFCEKLELPRGDRVQSMDGLFLNVYFQILTISIKTF